MYFNSSQSIKSEFFMVTKSLLVKLIAKPGKETAVEEFLKGGLGLVTEEPLTKTWYALKIYRWQLRYF